MNASAKRLLVLGMTLCVFYSCKKKNGFTPALAQITTSAITNVTTHSATAGGMITHNGGGTVSASGICWSRTNNVPTIDDDTIKTNTDIGIFTVQLTNLVHDVTYYVRAYVINGAGVGYGQTLNFTTTNAPAGVRNITFAGSLAVAEIARVRYTYFDEENDPEGNTLFQWYISSDTVAGNTTAITNATDSLYSPRFSDYGKFLKVTIFPRSSAGTPQGVTASSFWSGRIAEQTPETVDHVYNGQPVQYRTITSPVTGRKWLDRNLGAPNPATGYDDWPNKGDLFQFGRRDDGHQLINRGATSATTTAVNGITDVRSAQDVPGHSLFITTNTDPFNWRNPGNDLFWQMPANLNNVCPAGYHVPSLTEWQAENLGGYTQAFAQLKITAGGRRNGENGIIFSTQTEGNYWTNLRNAGTWIAVKYVFLQGGPSFGQAGMRTDGASVRCIKD